MILTALTLVTGWCCEPIVLLVHLLSGASVAGPVFLAHSLWWLLAAVTIKCLAFVRFEKRLPWIEAAGFMLLANVFSTIPGVLLAVLSGSGTGIGILVALPLVFFVGWLVQQRIARLPTPPRWLRISGGTALLSFVAFCFLSIALHVLAGTVLEGRNYAGYWMLKFLFVTLVATSGIVLSAVLEECVIAELTRKRASDSSYFTSLFRANYVTLGVVLLVAALRILPERLRSPHFITGWLGDLWSAIGLG